MSWRVWRRDDDDGKPDIDAIAERLDQATTKLERVTLELQLTVRGLERHVSQDTGSTR